MLGRSSGVHNTYDAINPYYEAMERPTRAGYHQTGDPPVFQPIGLPGEAQGGYQQSEADSAAYENASDSTRMTLVGASNGSQAALSSGVVEDGTSRRQKQISVETDTAEEEQGKSSWLHGGAQVKLQRTDEFSIKHQDALMTAGFGRFQYGLLAFTGLGLMADGAELFIMAFILPGAEKELCMTEDMKAWLGSAGFAGMLIGALMWGNLSDHIGRKSALLMALLMDAIFSFLVAVLPYYTLIVGCRFMSGIGVGGSIPICFGYYSEFCPQDKRGIHLTLLMAMWAGAGVFVSIIGCVVIPTESINFGSTAIDVHFGSWRLFLMFCLTPCLTAICGLLFYPESPRFLLEQGRPEDARFVYRQIHKANFKGMDTNAFDQILQIKAKKSNYEQLQEGEMPKESLPQRILTPLKTLAFAMAELLSQDLMKITLILSLVWLAQAFGYYGLGIWFPEYLRKLMQDEYFSKTRVHANASYTNTSFLHRLENTHFRYSRFDQVRFEDIQFIHVTFEHSEFRNCTFHDINSTYSFFENSLLTGTVFNQTDFWPYRFVNTTVQDSLFVHNKTGCSVDFGIKYNQQKVYLLYLVGTTAMLPGIAISGYACDKIGRVRVLGYAMIICGISTSLLWFAGTESGIVVMDFIFNCLTVISWNSIGILSTELYPTHLRTTGYGFLTLTARIAAIVGTVIYAMFIETSRALPILITAVVMAGAGFASLRLPESKDILL